METAILFILARIIEYQNEIITIMKENNGRSCDDRIKITTLEKVCADLTETLKDIREINSTK